MLSHPVPLDIGAYPNQLKIIIQKCVAKYAITTCYFYYTPSSATDPTPRLELSWQQKARQSHGHRNVLKKKWKSYNCRVVGHQSEVDSFVIATYQH